MPRTSRAQNNDDNNDNDNNNNNNDDNNDNNDDNNHNNNNDKLAVQYCKWPCARKGPGPGPKRAAPGASPRVAYVALCSRSR